MGQAFRRASGSVRRSDLDPSSSSRLKNVGDQWPPAVSVDNAGVSKTSENTSSAVSGKNFSCQRFCFFSFVKQKEFSEKKNPPASWFLQP